jgi:hypothetical protein
MLGKLCCFPLFFSSLPCFVLTSSCLLSRQLVAISRQLGQPQRVRVFLFDLLQETSIWSVDQLFLLASVWPESLCSFRGRAEEDGTETDVLLKTIMLLFSLQLYQTEEEKRNDKRFEQACDLLGWKNKDSKVTDATLDTWVEDLVRALVLTTTRIEEKEAGGRREKEQDEVLSLPLLSSDTYSIIKSLELISKKKGHLWTNNNLIVGKLWKLLEPSTPDPMMIAIIRSIGLLGKTMIPSSLSSPSSPTSSGSSVVPLTIDTTGLNAISQLQKRLSVVLSGGTRVGGERKNFSFGAQVAAAQSLIDLSRGLLTEVTSVVSWYQGLGQQITQLPKTLHMELQLLLS